MNAMVKFAAGASVFAALVGIGLSRSATSPDDRAGLASAFTRLVGLAARAPEPPLAVARPVAQAPTPRSLGNSVTIEPDKFGQFNTDVELNGHRVRMVVDTG